MEENNKTEEDKRKERDRICDEVLAAVEKRGEYHDKWLANYTAKMETAIEEIDKYLEDLRGLVLLHRNAYNQSKLIDE